MTAQERAKAQEEKDAKKNRDTNGKDVKEVKGKEDGEALEPTKKKQAVSISYTLKALKNNIQKLRKADMIDEIDEMEMIKIYSRAVSKYIEDKF